MMRKLILPVFLAIVLFLSGCGPRHNPDTGVVLDRLDVTQRTEQVIYSSGVIPQWSSLYYSEVNYDWLMSFNAYFKTFLFRQGVPAGQKFAWSEQFNCVGFTDLYLGLARIELFKSAFHKENQKDMGLPALIAVWYVPDGSVTGHSIVAAITNKGLLFIEPQTSDIITLSQTEIASIYHFRS